MKLIFSIVLLLAISCNTPRKVCFKDWVNKSKFVSVGSYLDKQDYVFVFNDSNYMEYNGDSLYAAAKVQWESCDKYSLVVQEVYGDSEGGLGQGDTLHVKVISIERDTVKCIASGLGFSAELKYLRIDKIK